MRGVLLAAGRGSRMGDLTRDRPKCLVELGGRPLFDWQVMALRAAGIDRLGAVRGWCGHRLEGKGVELFDNPRWAESNMVMSLAQAAGWLRASPCIVSYTDIVYQPDAVAGLAGVEADVAITYDPAWHALWSRRFPDPLADAESFRLDGDSRLEDIGRRTDSLDEVRGQYMGLLKFTPAGWARVERILDGLPADHRDRLDMTSLLRLLIADGVPVAAVAVHSPWGEVDSAEDLALYRSMLDDGTLTLPVARPAG